MARAIARFARRSAREADGHRDDAEGERRSVFRELPRRRRGGRAELGVDLIWDGPTGLDAARQNELVESWITRGVDVIAVAVENRASISTALRKAQGRGIRC